MIGRSLLRKQLASIAVGAALALIPYPGLPGAVVATTDWGAGLSTSDQGDAPRLSPVATITPTDTLMINGGVFATPSFGAAFVITGTAPIGDLVMLHFHKAGTPATDYGIVRTVTADSTGFWLRPIAANIAYRYYATAGGLTSATVLNAPVPTIDGAPAGTAILGSIYTLTGGAPANSLIYLHFHAAGTAPTDYSIIRPVGVDNTGSWIRPYLVTQDYRFFASPDDSNDITYSQRLIQAR